MRASPRLTARASTFLLIVAALVCIATVVVLAIAGPYGWYEFTCTRFALPEHEKVFGFRLGTVDMRDAVGSSYSSMAIVWVDPRGPLARSGFQVGDMPIGHHGLQEVCGALEEAREGRSASIRLFRAGVLQEREVLPLSPDHHRSAAER